MVCKAKDSPIISQERVDQDQVPNPIITTGQAQGSFSNLL